MQTVKRYSKPLINNDGLGQQTENKAIKRVQRTAVDYEINQVNLDTGDKNRKSLRHLLHLGSI